MCPDTQAIPDSARLSDTQVIEPLHKPRNEYSMHSQNLLCGLQHHSRYVGPLIQFHVQCARMQLYAVPPAHAIHVIDRYTHKFTLPYVIREFCRPTLPRGLARPLHHHLCSTPGLCEVFTSLARIHIQGGIHMTTITQPHAGIVYTVAICSSALAA